MIIHSRTPRFAALLARGAFMLLLASFVGPAYAQIQITTCVIDEESGDPVDDAHVHVVVDDTSGAVLQTGDTGCVTFGQNEPSSGEGSPLGEDLVHVGSPYPNPTDGVFRVSTVYGSVGSVRYEIHDLLGRRLTSGERQVYAGRSDLRFDMSGAAPGVYFVRITKEKQSRTFSVVKNGSGGSRSFQTEVSESTPSAPSPVAKRMERDRVAVEGVVHVSTVDTTSGVTSGSFFSLSRAFSATQDTTLILPLQRVPESLCPDTLTYVIVEEMPHLEGGLAAVQAMLIYPPEAIEAGTQGRIIVHFTVDPEGRVMKVAVVRGVSKALDVEAIRAVLLASFEPGRQEGEGVCVKLSLPITFRLTDP